MKRGEHTAAYGIAAVALMACRQDRVRDMQTDIAQWETRLDMLAHMGGLKIAAGSIP